MTQITTLSIPGRVGDARDTSTRSTDAQPAWGVPHFVVGKENLLVRQAAEAWLSGSCSEYSPWVIVGAAGVGKSHLARGMAARVAHARRQQSLEKCHRIVVTEGRTWNRQFGAAAHRHQLPAFRQRFGQAQLLVVDGLDALSQAPAAQLELAHTLDAVHHGGGRVLLTCRQRLDAYGQISPRLLSRLASGLTCQLTPPETETRIALIQTFAATMRLRITGRAVRQLALEIPGSVVAILETLAKLSANYPLVDLAACEDFLQRHQQLRPSLYEILSATASHFGLSLAELTSAARKRHLVHARGIAIHLARTLTQDSLQAIGRALGGRDHTTVLHQSRRMLRLVQQDADVVQSLQEIQLLLAATTKKSANK